MVEARQIPFPPEARRDNLRNYSSHIAGGIKMIRENRYADAMRHFLQPEQARSTGLALSRARVRMLSSSELPTALASESDVRSIANWVAINSSFGYDNLTIKIAGVSIAYTNIADYANNLPEPIHSRVIALQREISLVYLEEWLHGLQHMIQDSLTEQTDNETDVAAFMRLCGIEPSPLFMLRYNRGLALDRKEGMDDSADKLPSLRVGLFVRVRRESGVSETGWQVTKITDDAHIVVRNFQQQTQKTITKADLVEMRLGDEHHHPFATAASITDIFAILDQLVMVQGTLKTYTAAEVKASITAAINHEKTANVITQAGGLRLKVHAIVKNQGGSLLTPDQAHLIVRPS